MVHHAQDQRIARQVSDPSAPSETAEAARRLFAGPCDFRVSAAQPEHFDALEEALPEIAFWGRSNVGKSSLINGLTGRKGLARASNTPGRTQQIIFFSLGGRLMFADLPGYGHAKAPKDEIAKWNAFIKYYLKKRTRLRCVLLLIDARHGALAKDIEKMAFLDTMAVSYQVVMTKADQLRGADPDIRKAEVEALLKKHPAAHPDVLLTSAEKGEGIAALRERLYSFVEPD